MRDNYLQTINNIQQANADVIYESQMAMKSSTKYVANTLECYHSKVMLWGSCVIGFLINIIAVSFLCLVDNLNNRLGQHCIAIPFKYANLCLFYSLGTEFLQASKHFWTISIFQLFPETPQAIRLSVLKHLLSQYKI